MPIFEGLSEFAVWAYFIMKIVENPHLFKVCFMGVAVGCIDTKFTGMNAHKSFNNLRLVFVGFSLFI